MFVVVPSSLHHVNRPDHVVPVARPAESRRAHLPVERDQRPRPPRPWPPMPLRRQARRLLQERVARPLPVQVLAPPQHHQLEPRAGQHQPHPPHQPVGARARARFAEDRPLAEDRPFHVHVPPAGGRRRHRRGGGGARSEAGGRRPNRGVEPAAGAAAASASQASPGRHAELEAQSQEL